MPKGIPNKRYTPEFKRTVVETMREKRRRICEVMRKASSNAGNESILKKGRKGWRSNAEGEKAIAGRPSCLRRLKKTLLQRTSGCEQR